MMDDKIRTGIKKRIPEMRKWKVEFFGSEKREEIFACIVIGTEQNSNIDIGEREEQFF